MKVNRFILLAVFAVVFVFSCSSDGSDGAPGADGSNGANGLSCEARSSLDTENDYEIFCDGVFAGYLNNGEQGLKGEDGADGAAGADGTDGKDGDAGESCVTEAATGTELANGDFKVICGGVVVGYLRNGVDGTDGADGSDGADGADGSAGKDGTDGEKGEKGEKGKDGDDGDAGKDGVSCSAVDVGTHVEIRCGSDPAIIMSKVEWCDAVPYNPAAKFCSNDLVYDLCGGKSYNPVTHACHSSQLYSCGNLPYNPSTHSCHSGLLYTCGGKPYDPATHSCYGNQTYSCGGLPYNPGTHSCHNNQTYSCNNIPYDPATDFCYSNAIYSKCGGVDYNPTVSFCYSGGLYSCGNKPYNPVTQFCSGNAIYSKCGGVDYNPVTQYCDGSDNMVKNMSTCGSHDPTTHFCDARGGKLYKYIVIGTQTWMAENLNFNAIGSKCYNNLESNCDIYGRLYNWATAMDIAASYDSSSYTASAKHRGICPAGWHIPSDAEWTALTDFVGGESTAGTKLKAASGWNYHATYGNGTDDYGFSALPGGNGNSGGIFSNVGSVGYWWSASEDSAANAYLRDIYYNNEYAYWRYSSKTFLRSLRCSQD